MTKLIILIISILLFIHIIIENKNLKTTYYEIKSDKLPNEFNNSKIVMLSDLHNNTFGKNNQRLIKAINKENPDYILVAGDMIVSKITSNCTTSLNLLEYLSKRYPIYYSMGNHEQRMKLNPENFDNMYEHYTDKLTSLGIKLLCNETEYIVRNNSKIAITGLEIDFEYYEKNKNIPISLSNLEDKLGIITPTSYNILIAHNPIYFEHYTQWGADLILSGHMHGGIMILPILGGVISPQFKFFPKYYGGRFEYQNSTMVVSRGLGLHTIKIRVFNRPELIVINQFSNNNNQ